MPSLIMGGGEVIMRVINQGGVDQVWEGVEGREEMEVGVVGWTCQQPTQHQPSIWQAGGGMEG